MGQKVNPYGFRLGVTTDWKSKWIANDEDYATYLHEDDRIRKYIRTRVRHAGISRIDITRTRDNAEVSVQAARPGIVIGRRGSEADAIRADLEKLSGKKVKLNIIEIKNPDLDAQVVAFNTAEQLKGRVSFRRAMRRAVQNAQKAGALGVRVQVAGRLGGSEMSRTEWYREGRVPLHTLRAKVDYGFDEAKTTYGVIGVKVWIYTGDQLGSGDEAEAQRAMDRARALAEGRTVDDRPRRRSARKAASVAKKVTGVGKRQVQEAVAKAGDSSGDSTATSSATGASAPATAADTGDSPATETVEATTEAAPPQSGAMAPEDVTEADAPSAPDTDGDTTPAAPADAVVESADEDAAAEATESSAPSEDEAETSVDESAEVVETSGETDDATVAETTDADASEVAEAASDDDTDDEEDA
ncbi:30S ribosomal protein S3 [Nitriliruptoria bacterium AS10]|nr:30S ribosomal protein S3 [Salsipaludibacter albus]MBY5161568.1 30S ribosomal protein S3 [Salsipaludibacter albus]